MEITKLVEKRIRELKDEMDMYDIVIHDKRFDYCVSSLSKSISIIAKIMNSDIDHHQKTFLRSEIERSPMYIISKGYYD